MSNFMSLLEEALANTLDLVSGVVSGEKCLFCNNTGYIKVDEKTIEQCPNCKNKSVG